MDILNIAIFKTMKLKESVQNQISALYSCINNYFLSFHSIFKMKYVHMPSKIVVLCSFAITTREQPCMLFE